MISHYFVSLPPIESKVKHQVPLPPTMEAFPSPLEGSGGGDCVFPEPECSVLISKAALIVLANLDLRRFSSGVGFAVTSGSSPFPSATFASLS